jgi:outer membrane protein OmpA-like peptidoglycan-associated protein
MRNKLWSLAALSASLLASSAMAQSASSSNDGWMDDWFSFGPGQWYAGAKAGIGWMDHDTRLRTTSPTGNPVRGDAQYDDGVVGAINGGYAFNNGWDVELEGQYRYNDVNNIRGYGKGFARGSMRNYAVMANTYYHFPTMDLGLPISPFVGAGVGMADYAPYHIRSDTMAYPTYVGGPDKWGFAYQAMAGLSYALTDNISLSAEYRWFSRTDQSYPRGVTNDYDQHAVLFGVRYSFGAPAVVEEKQAAYVAPPPAPPQAPRNYLVFFDFNKSDLTLDAKRIVDQAADNAQSGHITQMTVTGHTDTVGSDAYNMRLSRRRAESVAAELEAKGVPSSEIEIVAKGKRDLLVPTADGVREPQNRRVQIVFSGSPTS